MHLWLLETSKTFMTSGLLLTGSHFFCVYAGWQNHSSTSAKTFAKTQGNPDLQGMLKSKIKALFSIHIKKIKNKGIKMINSSVVWLEIETEDKFTNSGN